MSKYVLVDIGMVNVDRYNEGVGLIISLELGDKGYSLISSYHTLKQMHSVEIEKYIGDAKEIAVELGVPTIISDNISAINTIGATKVIDKYYDEKYGY